MPRVLFHMEHSLIEFVLFSGGIDQTPIRVTQHRKPIFEPPSGVLELQNGPTFEFSPSQLVKLLHN